MPRKLELDALQADLAAVDNLLSIRTEVDDPIGWYQYQHRKTELKTQIDLLSAKPQTNAEVALFFGGKPVLGSRGIQSDFSSSILSVFQDLVAKKYVGVTTTNLASRGRIPQRETSQLMITDVVRGSFGFVLTEPDSQTEFVDSTLKHVVTDVVDLISRIASPDTEALETAFEEIDNRILSELRKLFQIMQNSSASLRIVEGDREFKIDTDAVVRGKGRVETIEIEEQTGILKTGTFYITPIDGHFNLIPSDGSEPLSGIVTKEAKELVVLENGLVDSQYNGTPVEATLTTKTIRERSIIKRVSHRLTGIKQL